MKGISVLRKALLEIFERDLNKLSGEIALYADEKKIWTVKGEISNSAGNLCLHLVGNLNHFIGTILGGTGYVRNRDLEFADKNVPGDEMIRRIDLLKLVVRDTLTNMSDADLQKDYPVEKNGKERTTVFMLMHLATHLNYHLGQINYHRRLIQNS